MTFKIISTRWGLFTVLAGVIYSYHLFWTVYGVDKYADYTRLNLCGEATTQDAASEVFDAAIFTVALFHMIEWVRWTVFLTSALVNVNLVGLFYLLSLNVPFGFVAMLVGIIARYSGDGEACAEGGQSERAGYLALQVICILVYIATCFAHVLFFKVKGVEWCHEQYLAEDEDDDD